MTIALRIVLLLVAAGAAAFALWPAPAPRPVRQGTAVLGPPAGQLGARGARRSTRTAVFSWPSDLRAGREADVTVELVPSPAAEEGAAARAEPSAPLEIAGEHLDVTLLLDGFELRAPGSQRRSVKLDPERNVISWQVVPQHADAHALRFVFTDESGNLRPPGQSGDPTFRPPVASSTLDLRRIVGLATSAFFGLIGFSKRLLDVAPVYRWLRKRLAR